MFILSLIILAIVCGAIIYWSRSRKLNQLLTGIVILAQIGVTCYAYTHLNQNGSGFFTFDPLGVLLAAVFSILLIAAFYHNYQYLSLHPCNRRKESIYYMSLVVFIAAINGAYYANHLGILWACIEATTLSVAALIYHERTDSSLEATWKYIFVCSIGITIAFTGILFISMAAHAQGITELNISDLIAVAGKLDMLWLRVGFLLIMTGYTAKMGIFPIHAAAIDAKTVAPFHINALMSTALVNVGFVGFFRIYSIIAGTEAFPWARRILILIGIVSLAVAAVHTLKVKHFKRLFAFSTMEHMGIVMLAIAAGGIGLYAAILHLILHSFAKASVFFQIGQVNTLYGSYLIEDTGEYIRYNPLGAIVVVLSLIAITAMPPSGLFITEFMTFKALFISGNYIVAIIALLMLTVILFVFSRNFFHLLFNKMEVDKDKLTLVKKRDSISQFALLALVVYLGINPPLFLNNLIYQIIQVIQKVRNMVTYARKPYKVANNQVVPLREIPHFSYDEFYKLVFFYMQNEHIHCVNYYALPYQSRLLFLCCLANDLDHEIYLLSHDMDISDPSVLPSLTKDIPALHIFEREIHEKWGIRFEDHPWLKPVRFPQDRFNKSLKVNDYPFYSIKSHELHEVGVGPIHAGVIEPGHFRFTCNGETVLHLEIQLGWQHRGIEKLFLKKTKLLERTLLAENIAGDTAIGHTLAFAQAMENLGNCPINRRLQVERSIALEIERIAIHTGDLSALCVDVAYQLGASVFGVLRTPIINFMQAWCGNRLGKSMIRAGGTHHPLTDELITKLTIVLDDYTWRFREMAERSVTLTSIQNRFENIGSVTQKQAKIIGVVGMAARMTGLKRDIRSSHPFSGFLHQPYEPIMFDRGSVFSRFLLRKAEIENSLAYIRRVLAEEFPAKEDSTPYQNKEIKLAPSSLTISLTEGWRGEICHCAVTDEKGNLLHYKIKDPSLHNWKALELSLRNLEISDFPINNKSYNLSYCGHDL